MWVKEEAKIWTNKYFVKQQNFDIGILRISSKNKFIFNIIFFASAPSMASKLCSRLP